MKRYRENKGPVPDLSSDEKNFDINFIKPIALMAENCIAV